MWRGESGGAQPRRFLRFRWNVPHAALFAHALFLLPAECFLLPSLRRPHFFQQRKKWGKERRQKPMVFGIPFIRLQLRCKKVPQRIASAPTLAAADMARREQWSPSRLGDYQIAHLPPAAASVGAARWPRSEARNIPFENKSAGRCGRRVRAQRPPVRKKERPPKRSFFFGSELSSN